MRKDYIEIISKELGVAFWQVENTSKLIAEGATMPFISRYRKEVTGSLDELQIAHIRDRIEQLISLDKRRESIINTLKELEKLTPELETELLGAITLTELEDIYLPYRPKRKTRASIAREKGLEPFAKLIMAQNPFDILQKASQFINPEKGILNAEEAIAGAQDIISEWINESAYARKKIRYLFENEAIVSSKVISGKEDEGQIYKIYFRSEESLKKIPSHRILAIFRGENEGFLRVNISPSEKKAREILESIFIRSSNDVTKLVKHAIADSYKRLLAPSIETEMRSIAKEKADKEAIRVFGENLRQLLLSPPLGQKNVLAIDPGFRSGCKLVCLDKQGKLLHNETIYPHPPQMERKEAVKKILNLVSAYKIDAIAIGNGTAGRETEFMIKHIRFDKDIIAVMVNESGASIYSASKIARDEFPEYDVTVRGAVSIGRRLMDPLAELVKIDPKSIGVGQYQHDVNQPLLQKNLEDIVISCVNNVGVEVNLASAQLLKFVSGLSATLAKNIIDYRNEYGPFKTRNDLKNVARFGEKAFEQAAGFLRIRNGENPLDSSAVHPESYYIVEKMANQLNCSLNVMINNKTLLKEICLEDFVSEKVGLPTLFDIISELEKPGRDPREKFDFFEFDKNVNSIQDLKIGMELPGIITNITNFGAFVDVGVHQDGLVHISQMANDYVSDPNMVVKLNQKIRVKVIDLDLERKRISFSMKDI